MPSSMPKKKPEAKPFRPRLVVYVQTNEYDAILKDVQTMGLKNAHAWAGVKLAAPIREVVGASK